jgi:O-antigen/teichoic acid export membrane protein
VQFGLSLDWALAKPHLKFGFYYQSAQFVSLVKDSITPILIGFLVGTAGVGYLSWASMLAAYPLLALMVLQRLYLPTLAHLQGEASSLARFMENIIWATNAVAAPFAILLLVAVQPITISVYGAKWLVAVPLFYLFWIGNLFVPTAMPVQSLLNAIGEADVATFFAVLWMVLTWAIGWPLAVWRGTAGIAVAAALVQITNIALFYVAKRRVKFHVLRPMFLSWSVAVGVGVLLAVWIHYVPPRDLFDLIVTGLLALSVYAGTLAFLQRDRFLKLLRLGFQR